VPKPTYVLNSDGRRELKRLVKKVCGKPRRSKGALIWNRTTVHNRLKCQLREEAIEKILKAIDPGESYDSDCYLEECDGLSPNHPPVQESSLISLFKGLYRATGFGLEGRYGENITDEFLTRQKLWEPSKQKVVEGRTLKETAELLRCLDASAQRGKFELALAEAIGGQRNFVAGVAVPCVWSQRWLIDCLINTPRCLENLLSVKIQVSEICFEMADVEQAVLDGLKCQSEDDLLRKLQRTNRPLIIALYNFGPSEAVTPQEVVQKFWEPLQRKLGDRKASSQIILLMVDYNLSSESIEGVKSLPSLSSISEDDVKVWMVSKMGRIPSVNEFSPDKWRWGEPATILTRVCQDLLGLKGLIDLEKMWRLS
jgi:hypothetical protein